MLHRHQQDQEHPRHLTNGLGIRHYNHPILAYFGTPCMGTHSRTGWKNILWGLSINIDMCVHPRTYFHLNCTLALNLPLFLSLLHISPFWSIPKSNGSLLIPIHPTDAVLWPRVSWCQPMFSLRLASLWAPVSILRMLVFIFSALKIKMPCASFPSLACAMDFELSVDHSVSPLVLRPGHWKPTKFRRYWTALSNHLVYQSLMIPSLMPIN